MISTAPPMPGPKVAPPPRDRVAGTRAEPSNLGQSANAAAQREPATPPRITNLIPAREADRGREFHALEPQGVAVNLAHCAIAFGSGVLVSVIIAISAGFIVAAVTQ